MSLYTDSSIYHVAAFLILTFPGALELVARHSTYYGGTKYPSNLALVALDDQFPISSDFKSRLSPS